MYNLVTHLESCYYEIPPLLYYSHIPTALLALLLGLFVYSKTKKEELPVGKILLFTALSFAFWSIFDLSLWLSLDSRLIMTNWSLVNILEMLVTSSTLYFAYVFLEQKDAPTKFKAVVIGLLGLFVIFIPTTINLTGFDAAMCEAGQGPLVYYFYFLETLFLIWTVGYLVKKFLTVKKEDKKMVAFFALGTILFLASFSGANLAGSFMDFIFPDSPNNWLILQYGLFGMPIFLALLTYVIVKFQTFNIKLILAQALVFGIVFLIGSQFAFIQNPINKILTGITLTIVSIFGWWLVRSVKKEILQREQLAKLLKQRETLMHLISHKVKGSFTRSKFIFDGLLGGIYGSVSDKVLEKAKEGLNAENEGIATVDLILNQANLQAGLVKYNMESIDIKQLAKEVAEIKRGPAEAKDLKMETEIEEKNFIVTGDKFWIKEVFVNLVDNAVKYTDTGKITVGLKLKTEENKALFYVKDTGIGITDEDKENLYTEGGRGKNSLLKNVNSTGYGLATVKMIIEAHHGLVWNESVVDKGSTFFVELPIEQKKEIPRSE